jgi:hypothetical protein
VATARNGRKAKIEPQADCAFESKVEVALGSQRSLTIGMMAQRIGVHKNTYLKIEKGDPTVSFGIYATALFVLGLSDALTALADPGRDDTGFLLDADHLPKRVRPAKETQAL